METALTVAGISRFARALPARALRRRWGAGVSGLCLMGMVAAANMTAIGAARAAEALPETGRPAVVPVPAVTMPAVTMPAAPVPSVSATASAPPRSDGLAAQPNAETQKVGAGKTGFVLSLSWQPAFCETHAKRPECLGQTAERADARQLSLIGLAPVRNSFCKVSEALQAEDKARKWLTLPAVGLTPELEKRLVIAMPGTASGLDRHLWLRSGSCQDLGPDAYFALQIRLLDAVNASDVGALFRAKIGESVTDAEVRAAFDRSFSNGAGARVRLQCRTVGDRILVTGLTIGLSTSLQETSTLADLVAGASPTKPRCAGGVLDAAGRSQKPGQRADRTDGVAAGETARIATP